MDWYASAKGKFSYFEDWAGFNIPGEILRPFYEGKFDPLTEKEKNLLKMLHDVAGRFYVIGSVAGNPNDLLHEVVHGLFYVYPEYRRDVVARLKGLGDKHIRERLLQSDGYDESVLDDEVNAYAVTGELWKWSHGSRDQEIRRALRKVFAAHFGCSLATKKEREQITSRVHSLQFSY